MSRKKTGNSHVAPFEDFEGLVAPKFEGSTVHVADASRVSEVVSALLDADRRAKLDVENRKEQERLREIYGARKGKPIQ